MRLFYCDESNLDPAVCEFFVYGGVDISAEGAAALSAGIEEARTRAGVPREHLLKFNPSPAGLTHQAFVGLKTRVVELAVEHGVTFIANLVLHRIAGDPDKARRHALNTVLYHFDCMLHRIGDHGLVLVDRFTDTQLDQQLRDRFSIGVTGLPYSPELPLERILGYHYSAIGQAHFTSLVDIVIGSFRYAVNSFSSGNHRDTAERILAMLAPLFLREGTSVIEVSLQFNPVVVKVGGYRERYQKLKEFLGSCGIAIRQEIKSS